MTTPPDAAPPATTPARPATARREFLGQLATATVALAGTACAGGARVATAPAPVAATPAAPPRVPPNDAWAARITGTHKAVFDSPAINDGTVIANAYVYMMGYKDVYKLADSDLTAVLVVRHAAIPMAVDDELWAKYDLGRFAKVKDASTGRWARRNPFWKAAPGDKEGADFTLDAMRARGAILLGCSLAARHMASEIAGRTKQKTPDVFAEVREHLVPGLELAPSGIFAVLRAQEAGCSYVRSA